MKRLFLVRHAKAKTMDVFVKDIDRPLSKTGYEDAYSMAEQISSLVKGKKLLVSSPSVRTYSTAGIFSDALDYRRSAIRQENSLYETGVEEYLDIISQTEPDVNSLLLFGHNPTISNLISVLTGKHHDDVIPGAVALFEVDNSDWSSIRKAQSVLQGLFSPKR